MKTFPLGTNGPQVSALCLGTLPFGTKVSESDSFALLDRYVAAGGSFLDTANNYSMWHPGGKGGESETVLGDWMAARGNRDAMFVATKAGFNTPETGGRGLSAALIRREVDKSLKRLRTDRIDLFYAHCDSREDPLEETLGTFQELIDRGKILQLGASNFRAWRLEKARSLQKPKGWSPYLCLQQRHSFLRPRAGATFGQQLSTDEEILDYIRENPEVRLLAYSPLLGGSYSRDDREIPEQYRSFEMERRLAALAEVAKETGATVNQVIYAWMLAGDPTVIPLIAPTTINQMEENLGALEIPLTPDQMTRLDGGTEYHSR